MSAIQNYQLSLDPTFKSRTESLLKKVATQIQGESPTAQNPQAAVDKRGILAVKILNDLTGQESQKFSDAIASQGTLTISSDDSDIEFTINVVFNDIAGVTYADLNP